MEYNVVVCESASCKFLVFTLICISCVFVMPLHRFNKMSEPSKVIHIRNVGHEISEVILAF